MCGFLGEFIEQISSEEDFINLLNNSRHRGPDQQEIWTDDKHCRLGFNRLSILDLSEKGKQPLRSPSGRYVLVFNGEIYNYRELQHQYGIIDSALRSQADSEVLAHLIDRLPLNELAGVLNGMFAICIYDTDEHTVSLIRDFAGIKPLYYGVNTTAFVAASQFDQVFQHPAFIKNLQLRPDIMKEYFGLGYMPAPNTIYQDIYQLEPGEWLTYSLDEKKIITKSKYFKWSCKNSLSESDEQTTIEFNNVFRTVVNDQLNSDVPLATFLSGGIDSPLVTAHAKINNWDLRTFTIGLDDPLLNESEIAASYSNHLKVNQSIEKLDNLDILEVVEEHFNILSEPMGDCSSLPTYLITKKAKFHATVMLSGDGGDELFWGYPRFLSQAQSAGYFNYPKFIRKPVVKLIRKLTGLKISYAIDNLDSFSDWTYNFQSYLFLDDLDKLVPGTSISKETQNLYSYTGSLSNKQDVLQWLKRNEFYGHLQRVLRKVDLTSMGNSLEVRVPFLDKRVIEFSNIIRPELSVKHRKLKYILKKALAEFIPPELIGHTKRGFSVPVNEYLRNELKVDLLNNCLQSKIYGADYLNVEFYQSYIEDFLDKKHDNGWGVWHFYAWQKWAKKYNLI